MTYADRERERAQAALGVVAVLAVVMGVLFGASLACGSALADQCEALYAGAQTPEELHAADVACLPDGGTP